MFKTQKTNKDVIWSVKTVLEADLFSGAVNIFQSKDLLDIINIELKVYNTEK